MYSKDLEISIDLNKQNFDTSVSIQKREAVTTDVSLSSGGTSDHNKLKNRDMENQHPISAITGLSEKLDTKQDVIPDIETIREGATLGSTALQAVPDEYITEPELNAKGYLTSYTETDPIYTADKPNLALKTEIPTVPTNVSSFANDAGYQTAIDVAGAIASIPQFEIKIVDELPAEGQKMILYLVPKTSASGDDIHDEYIWIESTSSFELVGTTAVDLSDYYTKTETNELLDTKVDKENGKVLISQTELDRLAGVDNYDDTQVKSDITSLQNEKTSVILRDWSIE